MKYLMTLATFGFLKRYLKKKKLGKVLLESFIPISKSPTVSRSFQRHQSINNSYKHIAIGDYHFIT